LPTLDLVDINMLKGKSMTKQLAFCKLVPGNDILKMTHLSRKHNSIKCETEVKMQPEQDN
jgi:hypothetical protein